MAVQHMFITSGVSHYKSQHIGVWNSSCFYKHRYSGMLHYSGGTWAPKRLASVTTPLIIQQLVTGWKQRNHQSSRLLAFCEGNRPLLGRFHFQMASNMESVLYHNMNAFCPLHLKILTRLHKNITPEYPSHRKIHSHVLSATVDLPFSL